MHYHGIKPLPRIKTWLEDLAYRIDRDLCIDQDEWAFRLGWRVTRLGFGARHYRDPRFDGLKKAREEVRPDVLT